MRTKTILWLLAIILPAAALTILAYSHRKKEVAPAISAEAAAIKTWQGHQFVRVEDYDFRRIDLKLPEADHMASEQIEQLRTTVGNLLSAYNTTDSGVFKKFRFPVTPTSENSVWDLQRIKAIGQVLGMDVTNAEADAAKVFMAAYEGLLSPNPPKGFPAGDLKNNCRACIKMFSPDSVRVFPYRDIKRPPGLGQIMNDTSGSPTKTEFFSLHQYRLPLNSEGLCTSAALSVLVKAGDADAPLPLYLLAVWDEKSRVWLPYALGFGLGGHNAPALLY